jgi:hypothetical protein
MPGGYAVGMYFNNTHVWYSNAWRVPSSWTWRPPNSWFAQWGSPSAGVGIWDWSCYD